MSLRDRPQIAPAHVARHVDAPRSPLARNLVGRRCDNHVGGRVERDDAAARRLQPDLADRGHAVAHLRASPHHDIEHFLVFVDFPDLRALHECRGSTADIRRRHADELRFLRTVSHLDLRHQHLRLHLEVRDAIDRANRASNVLGLRA